MKTIGKLLVANLKMTFRDKQALFWTLLFPTMFIVIFGLFNFNDIGHSKVALIDKANSPVSAQFADGLKKIEFFQIESQYTNIDEAKKVLEQGDLDFVIVIPENFKAPEIAVNVKAVPSQALPTPTDIQVYYNEANVQTNSIILSTLNQFIDEVNFQLAGVSKSFVMKAESLKAKEISYLDMLTPGIMAMAVMSAAIIGISSEIVKYREQKLLKRLTATPLKVRDFLVAQVFSYLILAVIQLSLIVGVAKFAYNVHFYGNIFLMYGLSLLGSLIFLSIGFTIAGIAKTVNAAGAMAQAVFMPMMFLSGVFYPSEVLPPAVYQVTKYLPLTPLIEALRDVANNNAGLGDIKMQLLMLGGWIVVTFLIAWKTFRFEKTTQ
ncbi:MAG: ABC transporter permease [Patescibacteria group bacterium]